MLGEINLAVLPNTLTVAGDSISAASIAYGNRAHACWPEVLATALRAANYRVKARNFAVNGRTSCQALGAAAALTKWDAPRIGVVDIGVNDPSSATTVNGGGATTTTVPVQAGKGAALVGGYVAIGGQSRRVLSASGDVLTLATALPVAPANAAAVTIDTQKNIEELLQIYKDAGADRVVVVSAHYLNFPGGDTTSVPYAPYVPVRAAQVAAAAAKGALFVNIHESFRLRIVNGQDVADSGSWHVTATNQHLNEYGHGLKADFIRTALNTANYLRYLL